MFVLNYNQEVIKMKKVLKNSMKGVFFYSFIILAIICVNLRYEYLNSNCKEENITVIAQN